MMSERDEHKEAGLITHHEAKQILSRFNASHWHKSRPTGGEVARYSIPADPRRDDDIRLGAYIARQERVEVLALAVLMNAIDNWGHDLPPEFEALRVELRIET